MNVLELIARGISPHLVYLVGNINLVNVLIPVILIVATLIISIKLIVLINALGDFLFKLNVVIELPDIIAIF